MSTDTIDIIKLKEMCIRDRHDADDHGVLHVTGGPVHVGEHEGGGPQGGTDHRGKQQHPAGQGPGLFRQEVELEDQGNGQGEDQVDGDVAEECQAKQAQGVEMCIRDSIATASISSGCICI